MNHKNAVLIFVISIFLGCNSQKKGGNSQESHIDTNMFEHHYITQDLPGETDWGYGCSAMADFDKDGDFDNDGDQDIFTCDQKDDNLFPEGAFPRWYIWENVSTDSRIEFVERVIYDNKLGGHDALVGDVDGDGDLDIYSKVCRIWSGSVNNGIEHGDFFENKIN